MSPEKKKWQAATEQDQIPGVHDLPKKNALALGLWCLYVSKHSFSVDYLTYADIENILREYLDIPMTTAKLKKSFAPAFGTKIIQGKSGVGCKISTAGETHLKGLRKEGLLNVVYVDPSRPREARQNLEGLVKSITKDELFICDPFYGSNTLDVLEEFVRHHKKINFLTAKPGGNEKAATLAGAVTAFKKQYGSKVEMRLASTGDFHDRYIIAKDCFLIIGHGIKDLGGKESLIVVVRDQVGKDIRKTLLANFRARWASATAL